MIDLSFRFSVPSMGFKQEGRGRAIRIKTVNTPSTELRGGEGYPFRFDIHLERVADISDYPILFLDFATLDKNPAAIAAFANNYGLLSTDRPIDKIHGEINRVTERDPTDFSLVKNWYPEIDRLRSALTAWQADQLPNPDDPRHVAAFARGTMCYRHDLDTARLVFIPDDLLGALWFQFLNAVARGARFKQCEWEACQRWFEIGPGSGKRKHARFCREKCRNDFHNSRRD